MCVPPFAFVQFSYAREGETREKIMALPRLPMLHPKQIVHHRDFRTRHNGLWGDSKPPRCPLSGRLSGHKGTLSKWNHSPLLQGIKAAQTNGGRSAGALGRPIFNT